tara:strand:+ start:40388 stop:41578 length:1191 start_codon:yes stop_codon:yes gene_type:complete
MQVQQPARTKMLRLMLASLGLNAALGISLVLVDDSDLLVRATLTSLLLTCSLALLLGGATATTSPRHAALGLGLIGSVLVQFPLALLVIWDNVVASSFLDRVAASWGIVFWLTSPWCLALLLTGYRTTRHMGCLSAAGTLASGLILLCTLWFSWNAFMGFDLAVVSAFALGTCTWVGSFSLITSRDRPARWQYLGIVLAICTACMWVYVAFLRSGGSAIGPYDLLIDLTVGFGLSTLLIGVIAICCTIGLGPRSAWIRPTTVGVMVAAVGLQEYALITDADWPDDLASRLALSAWILTACSLMAAFIIAWRFSWDRASQQPGWSMLVHCPACGRKQKRPLGRSQCDRCRQLLWLWCQMITCPECGYDLTGTPGQQCPECGLKIGVPVGPPGFDPPH